MSLSYPDAIAVLHIDGVTSVREQAGDALSIGIETHMAKGAVERVLRMLGIAKPVRFVVLSRAADATDAD